MIANPYFFAAISAVAMAGVVLTDTVMRKGVFTRPSQPLAVSCLLNPLCALPVYFFVSWHQPPAAAAWMALAAGVVLMLANTAYFAVMYSEAGESSEIAAFDAAAPTAIALITGLLILARVEFREHILPRQWFGVLVASASLAALHLWSPTYKKADWMHRAMLVFFALSNGAHMMLIDESQKRTAEEFAAAGMENAERAGMFATFPLYWLGLLTGALAIVPRKEWQAFKEQWPVIKSKWAIIMLVEVLATIAFAAQLTGFSGGHVAVIAMITGTFSLLVFFGGIALRRLGVSSEENFPVVTHPWRKVVVTVLLIAGIALASWSRH